MRRRRLSALRRSAPRLLAPRRWLLHTGVIATILGACDETPSAPELSLPRASTNVAPQAVFSISPRWPQPGDTVTFDASYAFDRDGRVVAYTWSLGNGVTQVSGPVVRTVYRSAGSYSVQLTAQDDSSATTTASMTLAVSSAGAPVTAVSASQSTVTLGLATVGAAGSVSATITARSAAGLPLAGVPVQLGGIGRALGITQPPLATDAVGVATATITTATAQAATLRAIADYTLLAGAPSLTVTAGAVDASASTLRLTDPALSTGGDTTLVEVTARDAHGNPMSGANVNVQVSGGTATVRNEGTTDADGRRVITLMPTTCGGTPLTVRATVNGQALSTTATVTSTVPAAYGVCGATFWLDATEASTLFSDDAGTTPSAPNARVRVVRARSGAANDVTVAGNGAGGGAALGAVRGTNLLNGRAALLFDNLAGQYVDDVSTARLNGDGYSMLVVYQPQPNAARDYGVLRLDSVGTSSVAVWWDERVAASQTLTSTRAVHRSPPGSGSGPFPTIDRTLPAAPALGAVHFDGSSQVLRLNRGTGQSASVSRHTLGRTRLAVGNALENSLFLGTIGEVLIFSRALSTSERASLEAALMVKWGLGTLTRDLGEGQIALAGSPVGTAPRVRLTDASGAPLAGATVTWQVTGGGGTITGDTTTTNANGLATVGSWTLGMPGVNTLTAWLSGTPGQGQSVVFTATGRACAYAVCGVAWWLDATDINANGSGADEPANNSLVASWGDRSGGQVPAVQSVVSRQPTYLTDALNGHPTLHWNADVTNGFLQTATNPLNPFSPTLTTTTFLVFDPLDDGTSYRGYTVLDWGENVQAASDVWNGGTQNFSNVGRGFRFQGIASPLFPTAPGPVLVTVRSSAQWQLFTNGGLTGSVASGAALGWVKTLGNRRDGSTNGDGSLTGRISEVLVFTGVLSDAARRTVELGLMAKWSLGLLTQDAGNGQTATVGTSPATAPRVRVTDATGAGIPSATVTWQVTGGGARFGSTATTVTTTTDASGYASVPITGSSAWTLDLGTNQLTAWLSPTAGKGKSVVFTATGTLPASPGLHLEAQDARTFSVQSGNAEVVWRDRGGSGRNLE
ncbi:MAG: Ig-like domain-containing protein [Gemmatimonas sp.]|uniref:Ig-like domain-containing protein n=1 Tax=Gemmatimonas sp. TaxID=1962908 RepID=UPI00391EE961